VNPTVSNWSEVSRQHLVDLLRKAGMLEEAERAASSLPDPVDLDQCVQFLAPYGITKDFLVSRLGGSP
jgi:hypothetical protein